MYTIQRDASNCLLRIDAEGFWSAEVVMRYLAALEENLVAMNRHCGSIDLLIDIRKGSPLPQDAAGCITEGMKKLGERYVRKMAYLVPSALHTLQVRRLLKSDIFVHQQFHSEEDALAWLADR